LAGSRKITKQVIYHQISTRLCAVASRHSCGERFAWGVNARPHSDELAVVEVGSFRQAAENLGMDSSMMSHGIKRLEVMAFNERAKALYASLGFKVQSQIMAR
jgi:hypothetical protein